MASQPVESTIGVSQVYRSEVRPRTWHLFRVSSSASSHLRPCDAQKSPQLAEAMFSKSISAEQEDKSVQISPFLTASQLSGSHAVLMVVGTGVGDGVGDMLAAVTILQML